MVNVLRYYDETRQFTQIATFGGSGPNHSSGFVPDPGSTPGTTRFLREDSTWANPSVGQAVDIIFLMDGGGATITTGTKGYIHMPFGCTINQIAMLADQSGSIVVDIWKCTYTQFDAGATHPVVGDSITASDVPTISTATKMKDTTLTGWTTTINADDVLGYHVNSATSITRLTVALQALRT